MDDSRQSPLIRAALRCYPARWRRRHGGEAAELAALLIADGVPALSIAWSYLAGALRERLTPGPRLRRAAAAALIAACSLGVPTAVIASTIPARAASTTHLQIPAHCHATIRKAGHDQHC